MEKNNEEVNEVIKELEEFESQVSTETEEVKEQTEESSKTEESNDIVVFISGSTDISEKDFMQYYFPILNTLAKMEQKIYFVVSDDDGTALLTQMCLKEILKDKSVVSVFNIGDTPKNYVCKEYVCVSGFKTLEERDAALTASSNKDVHIVLGGKGTMMVQRNICRRLTPKYDYRQYLDPKYNFPFWGILFNVLSPEQIQKFQEQMLSESSSNDEKTITL